MSYFHFINPEADLVEEVAPGITIPTFTDPFITNMTKQLFFNQMKFESEQKYKIGDSVEIILSVDELTDIIASDSTDRATAYLYAKECISRPGEIFGSCYLTDPDGVYYTLEYSIGGTNYYLVLREDQIRAAEPSN